ncbi:hypothetical protein AO262_03050 [Pseudomonas fluorescens ABAC62]|nr:hypothetical protein AO262_03050 [Pseudomonas fluorescens ABAC62]
MTISNVNLNLAHAGQVVDSVTSYVADQLALQDNAKAKQTPKFLFGGKEYTPRSDTGTLIPNARVG